MSRRALRKLQSGSKHSTDLEQQGLSESDDTDLSPTQNASKLRKTPTTNPYEVLERERTPSDNEAKEDDDLDVDLDDDQKMDNENAPATDSLKRKKKKKKKKVKETKDEDVEAVAQEVKEMLGETDHMSSTAPPSHHTPTAARSLLSIDYRHLQPENEMRRIFGSKVVQADSGKRKARGRGVTRATKLVVPRYNWPHVGKSGITMNLIETKQNQHYFKFEHSHHYQQIQFQFLDAVESLNPDNIVAVINMHPYHIDALLQVSDIMHMGEDMQMAIELVERALYCFENSFHPLFNIAQGNCRLDYRYDENRPFYIALFKHLTYVGRKGCYRTALEFCKVLLSLDPDGDPLAVILMVDFYALKALEYTYLIQMFEELEVTRNLSQLPNFAFSIPLAKFHLSQAHQEDAKIRQQADQELQDALLAMPGMLIPLLDKCNVQPDEWVSQHPFFGPTCSASHPAALMTLIQLYVGRCCHLWKEPEVVSWLEANVNVSLERVENKDPFIEFSAEKRKKRYQGMPRNIYRHILISEIKDATATLPPDMSRTSFLSFDPLPPTDAISSYSRPPRERKEADQNVLQALFRSLFPTFNVEDAQLHQLQVHNQAGAQREPAAAEPLAGAAAAASEGGNSDLHDFRRSVTSLLDAMRDLLTNIHFPELEQDGDADDSEEDDDDDNDAPDTNN